MFKLSAQSLNQKWPATDIVTSGWKGKVIDMFGMTFSLPLIWAILGLVLLISELATLTFILSFLGLGAFIVALTAWLGLTPGVSSQLVVFSISSLLLMFLFRKTVKKVFTGHNDSPPDYVGEKVKVLKAIPAGGEGTIAYRGSDWIAFSDGTENINEADPVEIVAMEGIRVKVKPVK
jgi:membrane protein implicated in regulation of membrane protease activity